MQPKHFDKTLRKSKINICDHSRWSLWTSWEDSKRRVWAFLWVGWKVSRRQSLKQGSRCNWPDARGSAQVKGCSFHSFFSWFYISCLDFIQGNSKPSWRVERWLWEQEEIRLSWWDGYNFCKFSLHKPNLDQLLSLITFDSLKALFC